MSDGTFTNSGEVAVVTAVTQTTASSHSFALAGQRKLVFNLRCHCDLVLRLGHVIVEHRVSEREREANCRERQGSI